MGQFGGTCRPVALGRGGLGFGAVVLATGSTMSVPKSLQEAPGVMTHMDALKNIHSVGHNVVIQGLGYGSELAIFLAETGRKVTLFGKGKEIASNLSNNRRIAVVKRLIDSDEYARGDGEIPALDKSNPCQSLLTYKHIDFFPVW